MSKGKQKAWRKGAQVVNILRSVMSDSREGHTMKRARSDKANAATATVGTLGRLCDVPGSQRLAAQGYTAPRRRSDRMAVLFDAHSAPYGMVHTGDDYVEQEYQAALNSHGHDGPADGAQA